MQANVEFKDPLWAISFKIDANGVTPIPPPTKTDTSKRYQSWWPSPNGPSRYNCREKPLILLHNLRMYSALVNQSLYAQLYYKFILEIKLPSQIECKT